jgi:hypothetical protein
VKLWAKIEWLGNGIECFYLFLVPGMMDDKWCESLKNYKTEAGCKRAANRHAKKLGVKLEWEE